MWLRDSANQLRSYLPILRANSSTKSLASLFRGAINMHARYVLASPHCNAFQPPPESGIAGTPNNWAASDRVTPRPDHSLVFECKWEPDSAAAFLQLSADYHERTQDAAFFAKYQWSKAVSALLDWLEKNQEGAATYNSDGSTREAPYKFSRTSDSASETLANLGAGEPVAGGTGLVRGAFRPSDDASIFGFLIPANMMLASNLARCAAIADSSAGTADGGLRNATLAARLRAMATKIRGGVEGFGKAVHRRYGEIYAYEVDGFGSVNLMDDANTPSLLSAPLLGYLDRTDPIYQNTRRFVLSTDNRYYMHGTVLNAYVLSL